MSVKKVFSKTLKLLLDNVYKEGRYYSIVFGKLRGLKLMYKRDIKFRYYMGLMEKTQFDYIDLLINKFRLDKQKLIVADVGANMGYYSLYFARFLDSESIIFAFEPSFQIFEILKNNILVNFPSKIRAFDLALAD